MQTIVYHNTNGHPQIVDDNSPWKNEPDKVQWSDETTGLPCLAVRNWMGAWCGYVGVDESHQLYKQDCNAVDVEVHGGLTYSDFCQKHGDGEEGEVICHIPEAGEPDNVWWFGFDCSHSADQTPYHLKHGISGGTYRTLEYIQQECRSLALQLQDYPNNCEHIPTGDVQEER